MPAAVHTAPLSRPLRPARGVWFCLRLGRVLLLGALLWPPHVTALDPERSITQYNMRTWRRTERLPSNTVNAIHQAADGHLLLGTPRGLVDFDGGEFRWLGLPGQQEARSRVITCLLPRRAGGLWVGLDRGGYGWFQNGRFFPVADARLGGDDPTIRALLETRDERLHLSVYGEPFHRPTLAKASWGDVCLAEDTRGRLWIGTVADGLWYFENGILTKVEGPAGDRWAGQSIVSLTVGRDGTLWVGTTNSVFSLQPDLTPGPATGIRAQAQALLSDSHGVLWVGTFSGGLLRHKDGVTSRLTQADGLAGDHVLTLKEAADGSLWVGTEDGLTQLSDLKFPLITVREGLAGDACLTVTAAPDGGVWAGTTNGLTRIVDGRCTTYGQDFADGFPSQWVRRILCARDGSLYLLGGRQDLNRFQGGRVVKTWHLGSWAQSLAEDAQGVLLTDGGRIVRLQRDELVPYRLADGTEPQFGWIHKLWVARDGALWVASDVGLAEIREGKLRDWTAGREETDRLFYDLCEDDDGGIWTVRASGLLRVRDGRLGTAGRLLGNLPVDHIYTIVPDALGYLWMDSPEGIFRVAGRDLEEAIEQGRVPAYTLFDGSHVARSFEKTNREYLGCRSRDGRIWFPNAKGVLQIDPARLPVNSLPPPIRLNRVLVDGSDLPADRPAELEAGARNIEFDYGAIDYQAPEGIRYRYRLTGYQTEWVDAGTRRSAFFTNLEPGEYRFEVQACNADGVWNTEGARFAFRLPPHLYQLWWFRAGGVALAFGAVGLFWRGHERRRRQEIAAIRHREELQSQMLESSPVPMVMFDRQRRIVYANAAFTGVFGYTAAELPDLETWWRLSSPDPAKGEDWRAVWRHRLEAAAAANRSLEPLELTIAHKDRSLRHVVVTTSAVGERTLVICADFTERKRAEDERRLLEEQLRQGQKMEAIGRLSGGIAHDFNNLLTIILGNLTLLEFESLPASAAELLRDIRGAATRAAGLTSQMLAFSRKQPVNLVVLDLNDRVTAMSTMFARLLGEDIEVAQQLVAGPLPIRADASMIEQVLLNLVINARDAMPRGGRLGITTAMVDIDHEGVPAALNARAGRFASLAVSDTGQGIAPELLPRIFEPFFTTKDVGKGTGLGLATVFGIVQQHNGWVQVESTLGQGSTFRVHLPLCAEPAAPSPVAAPSGLPPTNARGCTILLVEDEPGVRALAHKTLAKRGHHVFEAASGPEALAVWAQHRGAIEILFTDVMMPGGLNGIELAQHLLSEKTALKVVYASGYSADVIGGDFSGREGVDFLGKPYTPENLCLLMERLAKELGK